MIFHIAEQLLWEAVNEVEGYQPPSLETERFIHFSTAEQVLETAYRYYKGQAGLVLLVVDPAKLTAELRYEPSPERAGELFPHLYGPLNLAAVEAWFPFPPQADGRFDWPPDLVARYPGIR